MVRDICHILTWDQMYSRGVSGDPQGECSVVYVVSYGMTERAQKTLDLMLLVCVRAHAWIKLYSFPNDSWFTCLEEVTGQGECVYPTVWPRGLNKRRAPNSVLIVSSLKKRTAHKAQR